MFSTLVAVLLIVASTIVCGCSKEETNKPSQSSQSSKPVRPELSVHGASKNKNAGSGMVDVIKRQHLENYPATPVGIAFDGYSHFVKKEWHESSNSKGSYYIDFNGWFNMSTMDVNSIKEGVSARGVQVKFVIYESGSFGVAMVSRMEAKTDGKIYVYPLENQKKVLDGIYANKELSF